MSNNLSEMVADQFKFIMEVNSSSVLLIVLLQVQKRRHHMEIRTSELRFVRNQPSFTTSVDVTEG